METNKKVLYSILGVAALAFLYTQLSKKSSEETPINLAQEELTIEDARKRLNHFELSLANLLEMRSQNESNSSTLVLIDKAIQNAQAEIEAMEDFLEEHEE